MRTSPQTTLAFGSNIWDLAFSFPSLLPQIFSQISLVSAVRILPSFGQVLAEGSSDVSI